MKRRLFPALVAAGVLAGLFAASACDPDLTPVTVPGEAGPTEGGTTTPSEGGTTPTDSGTTPTDGGTTDGGGGDSGVTHKVDGVNDFAPGEKLQTTSSSTNYFAYVAWDAKNVYFGMEGDDVSASTPNASNKWVMIYLGRDALPGTTTGIDYAGEQQPTLPFAASIKLRWKVDGSYSNVQESSGGAWAPTALVPLTALRQGKLVEMSVTRASLGNPTKLKVHMNMLIEGGGVDHTYAGVPSTSFTDGKDPDFTKYYEFDLTDLAKAPNTYAIKP